MPIRGGLLFNGDSFGTMGIFGAASVDGWFGYCWRSTALCPGSLFVGPRIVLTKNGCVPVWHVMLRLWFGQICPPTERTHADVDSHLELVSGRQADHTPESLSAQL